MLQITKNENNPVILAKRPNSLSFKMDLEQLIINKTPKLPQKFPKINELAQAMIASTNP